MGKKRRTTKPNFTPAPQWQPTVVKVEDLYENKKELEARILYSVGSIWRNRKGTYEVQHIDPETQARKIRYLSLNEDYISDTPSASPKRREWWTHGFATALRIHRNIEIEEASDDE